MRDLHEHIDYGAFGREDGSENDPAEGVIVRTDDHELDFLARQIVRGDKTADDLETQQLEDLLARPDAAAIHSILIKDF